MATPPTYTQGHARAALADARRWIADRTDTIDVEDLDLTDDEVIAYVDREWRPSWGRTGWAAFIKARADLTLLRARRDQLLAKDPRMRIHLRSSESTGQAAAYLAATRTDDGLVCDDHVEWNILLELDRSQWRPGRIRARAEVPKFYGGELQ